MVYPTGVRVSMTMHSEPTGPGTRVGGGGGGRGRVWHHAAQGTRPAGLRYSRALHSLYPVPHRKGTSAEGRHLGAPGHPPPGPRTSGATLCSCLPCNLQSFQHHQHPHRAAVPEVRVSQHDISTCHVGCSTALCLRLLLPFLWLLRIFKKNFKESMIFFFLKIHILQNVRCCEKSLAG